MEGDKMHMYWAQFETIKGEFFRFDTRIYLNEVKKPNNNDVCIGAIVGKNPGSAAPFNNGTQLQQVKLKGDRLLPTVRNIVLKAYDSVGVNVPDKSYIQVLNLFYICEPDLYKAIKKINNYKNAKICVSELNEFLWIWYVWGGKSARLDNFKKRFGEIKAVNHFYFDKHSDSVITEPPSKDAFAKHTQGLKHDSIVPHISKLLGNG